MSVCACVHVQCAYDVHLCHYNIYVIIITVSYELIVRPRGLIAKIGDAKQI